MPLQIGGSAWGLVEGYRTEPRAFGPGEVQAATKILERLSARTS